MTALDGIVWWVECARGHRTGWTPLAVATVRRSVRLGVREDARVGLSRCRWPGCCVGRAFRYRVITQSAVGVDSVVVARGRLSSSTVAILLSVVN